MLMRRSAASGGPRVGEHAALWGLEVDAREHIGNGSGVAAFSTWILAAEATLQGALPVRVR
jgi:hypothetical protein